MIKIALVDDEEKILKIVSAHIKKSSKEYAEVEIFEFKTAEELVGSLENNQHFDIVFADIELPGMSGIELGKIIREQYPEIYLVYLTAHSEFAAESYAIEAHQYILKNQMAQRLPGVLKKIIIKIEKEKTKFRIIGTALSKQKLYYKDIIYIHKKKAEKYVQYVTCIGDFQERITLDQLLQELHSGEFLLVERGYIVNMRYISGIKGNVIYMENNKEIAVSRNRMNEVKEKLTTYWRQQ